MTPKQKIQCIIDNFGMKLKTVAIAIGTTEQTAKSKMSDKNDRHNFNEKNLQDLKNYVLEKARQIEKL